MKVEFHSGVADKLAVTCRFLRKAQAAGAAVVVCGDPATLDRLDLVLWTTEPLSFMPHVRVKGASPARPVLARTPTWLVDDPATVARREVLLNLGPGMVAGWEQFERVVEIVSAEPGDAGAGRERWRQYGARPGVDLVHHARGASA
jgi:DNA polymerase III subunit chi